MPRKKVAAVPAQDKLVEPALPDGLLNEAPVTYPVAGVAVVAQQVYLNPERRPTGSGPWDDEADKIAWVDAETGLGCIMLRQENGTLSGYVSIGPDHPLFGYAVDALPIDFATCIHGGITYARACEVNRFARKAHGKPRAERYTVCHVTRVRMVQDYRTVQTTEDEFAHEDLWWLGFDTDHPGDFVPKGREVDRRRGDVYRDQAFVYAHCIELARRLKAAEASPDEEASGHSVPQLPPPSRPGG
jgi:hypothetical protein